MANHPAALKRMRQNAKRRARNRSVRARVRTEIKKTLGAIEEKNVEGARESLRAATSILHKSASKGVYHKNTASRQISRLSRQVNAMES